MAYTPNPILQQKTPSRQVDDLQRSYVPVFSQLQALVPLNGVYVSGVTDSAGVTTPVTFVPGQTVSISHNMGRPYLGWQLCRPRYVSGAAVAPLIVEVAETDTTIASSVLKLSYQAGTATVYFDVWVY